ncbi:putative ABC transporter substrate binding protein [Gordonia araii NBRC 100433]|uniref:Putative ABC transporter substrate binding protein n=1 Tax=Gordonia araii NBRC 100433 TaxID=1073574 RepID=G7H1G6_9ACTN|nr:zinc ABC transporter substrate-binding protein [Gordonia araii]NNG97800.1 zinc ABC transporter solute-binding protein [Gordonia araii NBRC 100433]GAB09691.1 putative ABC transporter substrate binding protein [Gordonia araii NBRC 100433]
MRHPRRVVAATAASGLALVAVLSGCSGSGDSTVTRPYVVTSTNVWGSVAEAVVGDHGTVKSLYTSPDGDPHEFTPSAADSASVADADIVLINGGHYDEYLSKAKKSDSATVIDASELLGIKDDDHAGHAHGDEGHEDGDHEGGDHGHEAHGDDHGHEGHAHDDGSPNEHVFYNLTAVRKSADALANALAKRAPDHAADYRRNATDFGKQLDGLQGKLNAISAKHKGTKVAQTEPLAGYLIEAAGLVDASPRAFIMAVENGQSPSAADRAKLDDLLTSRIAKALIYNTQSADAVTAAVRTTAERSGVPLVTLTESLPAGVTTYVQWQGAQIDALAAALDK